MNKYSDIMKTKEEVIKEAWSLIPDMEYDNIHYWSIKVLRIESIDDELFDKSYIGTYREENHQWKSYELYKIRPKSLQGIEDNNGWIRIESEEDLPNESGDYWVYDVNRSIDIRFYMGFSKTWGNHEMEADVPKITHYQPIVKPKPPLY